MEQLALMVDGPRSRVSDPRTSHIAADRIKASGALASHQHAIRTALRSRPGMTYREIAEYTGMEPVAVGRRLKELEHTHVYADGERNGMRVFWPVLR